MEQALMSVIDFVFSFKMLGIIIAVFLLFSCIFMVNGKTAAIIETFGKPNSAAAMPGLRFKAP